MELTKLIKRLKKGDPAAFEEMYNKYYQMGFSLALQFVKKDEDAMDIMQETFITVCSKIDSLQDETKFKSWYMQIVANKCRDFLKKKNPESFSEVDAYDEDGHMKFEIEDDDRDFKPEEATDYAETIRIVDEMLDNLPEDQKMCLLLFYANEMKITEIAEALNISEATVKSRLKYGKDKLRVQVEDYEKKNGTKLRGVTGISIVPFIRWMLANKNNQNIDIPLDMCEKLCTQFKNLKSVNNAKGFAQVLVNNKVTAFIVSGVVAATLVTGGVLYPIVNNGQNGNNSKPAISDQNSSNASSPSNLALIEKYGFAVQAFIDEAYTKEYNGDWTNTNLYIKTSELKQGEQLLYRTADNSEFILWSSDNCKIDSECDSVYQFKIKSEDGTESEIIKLSIKVDKTAPEVAIDKNNWYAEESLANHTASIYGSGNNKVEDIKTMAELEEFEKKYGTNEERSLTYGTWSGTDGGIASRDEVVNIVKAKEWASNSKANLNIKTNDDLSGINYTLYEVNGEQFSTDKSEFLIDNLKDGTYKVKLIISDKAGNVVEKEIDIKKDIRKPQVILDGGFEKVYSNKPVSVKLLSDGNNVSEVSFEVDTDMISDPHASGSGLNFNGTSSAGWIPYGPGEEVFVNYSSKLNIRPYSEAGLYGDVKTKEIYISSEQTSSEQRSNNSSVSSQTTTPSKTETGSKPTSDNSTVDLSGMEYDNGEYFDKSNLTFTQADVGKVVGYSPVMSADIIVFEVDETPISDGRKCVQLVLGYRGEPSGCYIPNGFSRVECKYCHEFPCSAEKAENCPKYDPLKDSRVTCQICGRPTGNGYYGTCYGRLNWNDPTKPFYSCNHYDNCLNCGKPVGDGYNGTCHITWGNYSGITTCNYYD